jgi:hypothetical protein
MTRQEMFDKAVCGLRSQNWQRCVTEDHYLVFPED